MNIIHLSQGSTTVNVFFLAALKTLSLSLVLCSFMMMYFVMNLFFVGVGPNFLLLSIKTLFTRLIYGLMFSSLLDSYLGVELLDYRVSLCLILQEKAKLFSKVSVPFYILTTNNDILLLLPMLGAMSLF